MQGHASLTAKGAATHRAVHQLLEGGAIFKDPLALAILGEDPDVIVREAEAEPRRRYLRLFVVARSRFAEERLAEAVQRGVRQAVTLGAGLDTFGLRNPHRQAGLKVFEVDHPATQAWKQARIAEAKLSADMLHFTPVDFERQNFVDELKRAGFDEGAPSFFLWLGVVPYLTLAAIGATLQTLGRMPAEVVFDYGEPMDAFDETRRAYMAEFEARVAALGEPILSRFRPAEISAFLTERRFTYVEDVGPHEMARYLGNPSPPPLGSPGGHVVYARSAASATG
jgi:methyltransferase (TIGR00027 family)